MAVSWFTYAGTFKDITTGNLLIPDYAQEWAGTNKLTITQSGEFADFAIAEAPNPRSNYIDGYVLIGIFEKLYKGEKAPVSLTECFRENWNPSRGNKTFNKLFNKGLATKAYCHETPYSLKITKDPTLTYETCPYYSPCGQFYNDEEESNNQKYWNVYFNENN